MGREREWGGGGGGVRKGREGEKKRYNVIILKFQLVGGTSRNMKLPFPEILVLFMFIYICVCVCVWPVLFNMHRFLIHRDQTSKWIFIHFNHFYSPSIPWAPPFPPRPLPVPSVVRSLSLLICLSMFIFPLFFILYLFLSH